MNVFILTMFALGITTAAQAGSPCHKQPLLLGKKEGGGVANGGDGFEGEFCHYANKLEDWIFRNRLTNLDLPAGTNPESKTIDLMSSFKDLELVFDDQPIVIEGKIRTCENIPELKKIHCNNSRWKAESPTAHYITTFHEFLGLVNLEGNSGTISTYPIASQLVPFFEERLMVDLMDQPTVELMSYIVCREYDELYKAKIFAHKLRELELYFFPTSELSGFGQGFMKETVSPWMRTKRRKVQMRSENGEVVAAGVEYSQVSLQKKKKAQTNIYSFVFKNESKKFVDQYHDILFTKKPKWVADKNGNGSKLTGESWTRLDLISMPQLSRSIGEQKDHIGGQLMIHESKDGSWIANHPDYLIFCDQEFGTSSKIQGLQKSLSENALKTE